MTDQDILQGDLTTPKTARCFISTLNQYSGEAAHADKTVSEDLSQKGRATLGEVRFAPGSSTITADSEPALSEVAKALKHNSDW